MQTESSVKLIVDVVTVNQDNETGVEDYENLTSQLLKWVGEKTATLTARNEATTEDISQKLEEFGLYCSSEKPAKLDDKTKLENLFNTLQTGMRVTNRPVYVPREGHGISDVNTRWAELEQAEKNYLDWALNTLRKLERLESLAMKFKHKCDVHESWANGQDEALRSTDVGETTQLASIIALLKKHEAFESDLAAHQDRIEQIVAIAQELNALEYSKGDSINARSKKICDGWDNLGYLTIARREAIEEKVGSLQRLDNLWMEYAKKASPFNNWMDGAKEELLDLFKVHTLEEIMDIRDAQEKFKANMAPANDEYETIMSLKMSIDQMTSEDNPYTSTKAEGLRRKWGEILDAITERDYLITAETATQQNREAKRVQFAQLANELGQWLLHQTNILRNISIQGGSLEVQLQELAKFKESINDAKNRIVEVAQVGQELRKAMVFENPHTPLSMEVLQVRWDILQVSISREINTTKNQMQMGIPEDRIRELRSSFNYFDRDCSYQLQVKEFQQSLVRMGQNVTDDPEDPELKRILQRVDPGGTGLISFEAFLYYVTSYMHPADPVGAVMEAFRVLSGDLPYITADTLRQHLPTKQADYCIARMEPFSAGDAPAGSLDYRSFSKYLYGDQDL